MNRIAFTIFFIISIFVSINTFAADSKYEIGVVNTATAIINEAANTPDHTCRLFIAIEWWKDPVATANFISPYLSAQNISASSSQQDINNGLSAFVTTEVIVRKALGVCN